MATRGNFAVLAGGSVLIMGVTLLTCFVKNFIYFPLVLLLFLGFAHCFASEINISLRPVLVREDLLLVLGVLGGALISFSLHIQLGLESIVAAALIGMFASLTMGKYAVPIYCGAFVGMASGDLFDSIFLILAAAILTAGLFVYNKSYFNGFGGKLGLIAFAGSLVVAVLGGGGLGGIDLKALEIKRSMVIYVVMGAIFTYLGVVRLNQGAVLASSLSGLTGGLVLPAVYPETGVFLAAAFFCGSFVGMTAPERLPGKIYIALAGLVAGIFLIFTLPVLGGPGGKMGAVAFASTIAVRGLLDLYFLLKAGVRGRWNSALQKNY